MIGPVRAAPSSDPSEKVTPVWANNPAAWVGIVLCIVILLVWLDRNTMYFKSRDDDDRDTE